MRTVPTPVARMGILVLVVAVVFCLAVPMAGGDEMAMQAAMLCCFVLAVLLAVAFVGPPRQHAAAAGVPDQPRPRSHGVRALARAPDPITLGALLI